MSDQPRFDKLDEQEATYAPQQMPADTSAGDAAVVEEDTRDTGSSGDEVSVPAAGAGLLGQTGGGIGSGIVGGAPSAVGPVVGGAAPEDETAGDRPV